MIETRVSHWPPSLKKSHSNEAGLRLGQEGKPAGQDQWGMWPGTEELQCSSRDKMQRLSLNAAPEKKKTNQTRRSACNEASYGSSQLWHGCFHSRLIQSYSHTTAELALSTGSHPLCVQGSGTGCCASVPGNTKILGRKVCVFFYYTVYGNYQKIKRYWKIRCLKSRSGTSQCPDII